jgi:CubicO group peptidase (beta-lactamase class C family)
MTLNALADRYLRDTPWMLCSPGHGSALAAVVATRRTPPREVRSALMTGQAAGVGLDATFETLVRERMARWSIPGATLGELGGDTRREAAFGVTSLETGYPVRPDSLFQIGSITKVFTTTLVMMLVEESKLDLDAPVISYLPNLKLADASARRSITLRMLLCHSSGFFGDFFADFGWGDDALRRYVDKLDTLPQQTPPGTSWAYNNAGFCLAGALIEQVTGQPYERVMRDRVFQPLGLTHTFYYPHEAIAYPVAVGHTQITPAGDEHEVARLYPLPRAVNAAGGIISTVDDLLTFAAFHIGGGVTRNGQRLLPEAAVRAMGEPQISAANFAEAYGLGWETRTIGGVRLIGHGGSTNGFNARLLLIPERRYAIAILTNSGRGATMYRDVVDARLAELFGLRSPKPDLIQLSKKALDRFAGVYQQTDVRVTLTATDEGLRGDSTFRDLLNDKELTYPTEELRPISAHEFMVIAPDEEEGSRWDFLLDGRGHPKYLRMGGRLYDREHKPGV